MPTIRTILPQISNDVPLLRVAAYCRVSSDSDDQLHSFAAQTEYYTKLIGENPLWTLADIYADEGITGTSMRRRDEFKRMIADCKKGKIDRILTKSVSRFARNTVDCLETVRMLSGLGISILFEKEQLDTAKMSSEVLLAFISTQAQDESVSISGNMRWSYEKRMKSGNFICCYTPYGYRWTNHRLTVIPEEAEIVKQIYADFLSGIGMVRIAKKLNDTNVPHRHGGKWTPEAIDYILHNEKYMGDALLQKFYTTMEFPARQKENRGERAMYYVRNSHEPIISKETYEAVQELTKARRSQFKRRKEHHPLTGFIRCGECGHPFRRVGQGSDAYWKCSRYIKQKTDCTPVRVDETDIVAALVRACNTLRQNPDVIESLIEDLNQMNKKAKGGQPAVKELDSRIATLSSQLHLISQLQTQGVLDPADFAGQQSALSSQIMRLRSERSAILRREDEEEIAELRDLADILADSDTDFTANDIPEMLQAVQGIRVESETDITVILLGGLQIPEQLPIKKRR